MRRLCMNLHKTFTGILIKTEIWGKVGDPALAGGHKGNVALRINMTPCISAGE